MIVTVKQFNKDQEARWQDYLSKCKENGVRPQRRDKFNQFMLCPYKTGYVQEGMYWRWKKRKEDFY